MQTCIRVARGEREAHLPLPGRSQHLGGSVKRTLLSLVVGLVLVGAGAPEATAVQVDEQHRWRFEECRFRNYNGSAGFSRTEIELIVICANRHWPVPGGWHKAFDVIACESGWGPHAVSPGGHLGLFQFAPDTYAGVRSRWAGLWHRWNVPRSPFNARANALAGMRKASADGWGAWSCA